MILIFFLLSLIGFGPLYGKSIQINPIRQQMESHQKTTSLEVINNGEDPITFQISIKTWKNILGQDKFDDTNELLVTPPIFTIAPQEKQIVRVGLQKAPDPKTGAAYRIYIKEVPAPKSKDSQKGTAALSLVTLLELSVPIVVAPSVTSPPQAKWTLKKIGDKKVKVSIQNQGQSYISLQQISLRKDTEKRAFFREPIAYYILPSVTKEFEFNLPCSLPNNSVEVEALTDQGELKATVPVQVL